MINTDDWKRMETLGVTDLFEHHADTLNVVPSEITPHHYATWRDEDGELMLRIIYKDEQGHYHFPDEDGPYGNKFSGGGFPV